MAREILGLRTNLSQGTSFALGLVSPIVLFGAWCVLSYGGFAPPDFLPSPTEVLRGILQLFIEHDLWSAILISSRRIGIAFLLASAIALPLGVMMGAFEAVNRIAGKYTPYLPGTPVRGTGSMEAAAATAAHDVLVALCPDQAEGFAGALKSSLAEVKDAKAREAGAKVGKAAAAALLAARADSGANVPEPLFDAPVAGAYGPTIQPAGGHLAAPVRDV